MRNILLPKGMKKLKDESGREVDYDVPMPVFSPGLEAGILEQVVLSLYFRGGDEVIDRPYVVRKVEQPLTKFFINQLSLYNVWSESMDSWEDFAHYLSSEHVLVTPNNLTGRTLVLQQRFERLIELLNKDNTNATSGEINDISNLLKETLIPCTRLRDPKIISILHDFQRQYKKPDNPKLAVILDMYRRIIDKSLQGTQTSSKNTITKLVEQYEQNPIIQHARLVDVFVRQHVALGFEENRDAMYNQVKSIYLKCVNCESSIEDKVSSYASLIIFERLLGQNEEALRHINQLKKLPIPKNNLRTNHLRNLFLSNSNKKPVIGSTSKLGIIGLEDYFHLDILKTIYFRLKEYNENDGKSRWIPYSIDLMESLIEHSKLTKLHDIYYQKDEKGNLYRNLVFNHNPYIKINNQKSGESCEDWYEIKQEIPPNYFGFLEKVLSPFRDYLKKGRVIGEPGITEMLLSDVDRYLFAVPDIKQDIYSPGSSMIATLPTKPKLERHGTNGHGPIETEKYTELQKS